MMLAQYNGRLQGVKHLQAVGEKDTRINYEQAILFSRVNIVDYAPLSAYLLPPHKKVAIGAKQGT